MRSIRVLWAVTSLASLAVSVTSAVGCARGEGEEIVFTHDSGTDGPKVDSHVAVPDATTTHVESGLPDTGGADTFVGLDVFVQPPFDSGFDAGMDSGMDSGLVFFGSPNTPCTTLGAVQAQTCGICGQQTSTCIVRPDGGVPFDAGMDSGAGATDAAHDSGTHDAGSHDGSATGDLDGASDAPHDGTVGTEAATDAAKDAPHDSAHDTGEAAAEDAAKDAAKDAGKDAGPDLVWGLFGACTNEIPGGCVPGTTSTMSCGFCGTQTVVCEPDCELGATNCVGQVDGGCAPGTVDFVPDPTCSDSGIGGKEKTCTTTCEWNASSACVLPPSTLTISSTAGGKVDTFVAFVAAQEDPLLDESAGFCPTTLMTSDKTPYGFVTFTNSSTTQMATISVWTSQVAGQPQIDTAITAYASLPPNLTALEKDCTSEITDTCFDMTDPTSCQPGYGGLMLADFNPLTIPAGGTIVVFVQDQLNDPGDLGTIQVTARTESFM